MSSEPRAPRCLLSSALSRGGPTPPAAPPPPLTSLLGPVQRAEKQACADTASRDAELPPVRVVCPVRARAPSAPEGVRGWEFLIARMDRHGMRPDETQLISRIHHVSCLIPGTHIISLSFPFVFPRTKPVCRAVVKIKGNAVGEDVWHCAWKVGCAGSLCAECWLSSSLGEKRIKSGSTGGASGWERWPVVVGEPLGIHPQSPIQHTFLNIHLAGCGEMQWV